VHLSSGARCRQGRRERKYRSPTPCPNRVDDISEAARRGAVKIALARLGRDGHEIKLSSGPLIGHWLLSCFIAGHLALLYPPDLLSRHSIFAEKAQLILTKSGEFSISPAEGSALALLGLVPSPPWARAQLQVVRERTDQAGRRRGTRAAHGTITRWNAGCSCTKCRQLHSDTGHEDGAGRKSGSRSAVPAPRCNLRGEAFPCGGPRPQPDL
jgi:hypothetical protein